MLAGRIALISLGLWSVSAGCGEPESVQLVIDGTEHSFGTVPYCEDARAINVVVSNTGTGQSGPLAVGLMPTAPTGLAGSNVTSDFRIEQNGCHGVSLAPGGSCALVVRLVRNGGGKKSMRLWAEATPGGNAATTLIAFREVVPSPVALDRRDHSFGKLAVGATSPSVEVVVTNASGKPWRSMGATMIQSAPDFLLDWNDCTEAGPPAGGSCTLGVRFSPQSPGPKEVRLNVAAAADCRLVLDSAALTGLAEP